VGYTQYWKVKTPFTDEGWKAFIKDVKAIFKQTTVPLANGMGEKGTKPVIGADQIMFNGVEDDSHETCCIVKGETDFDFCKTSLKPYDAVVVQVLKAARKHNPSTELSSDGDNVFNDETET